MQRIVRPEENPSDGAQVRPGKPGVARRMSVQIAEPLDARLLSPQAIEPVRLELIVACAADVGVLRPGARRRTMRHLEPVAADESKERHAKLELSIGTSEPDDFRKNAFLQRQGFHARWYLK